MHAIVERQQQKSNKFAYGLVLLAIGWGLFLFSTGRDIVGPFIFSDELAYFTFAKSIFNGDSLQNYTQYGPLYPAVISLLFFFNSVIACYKAIKLLNVIIFLSAVIPAYLLAKAFFSNQWLQLLLPIWVLITPFSGFVYLIWAEPLYIGLFYWACYFAYRFFNQPRLIGSVCLGVSLALLYYTKTAAGLVAGIAAFLCLSLYLFMQWKTESRNRKYLALIAATTYTFLILPWMLHYHHLNVSIIGYPTHVQALAQFIDHNGYLTLVSHLFYSLFYQFSYVFVGSWGLVGVGSVLLLMKWRDLKIEEKYIILFVFLTTYGLIALSALGMAGHEALDYRMPQGRYFSLLLPIITTCTLYLLCTNMSERKYENKLLIVTLIATVFIAMVASPLYTLSPLAFNSMPELSPIIYLFYDGDLVWRPHIKAPTFFLRMCVPIIFGLFALSVLLLRKWRQTPALSTSIILFGTFLFSLAEHHYIHATAMTQYGFNKLYIYLIKKQINISEVTFDKRMHVGNAQFLTPFWMGTPSVYQDVKVVLNGSKKVAPYFVSEEQLALAHIFSAKGVTLYKQQKGYHNGS